MEAGAGSDTEAVSLCKQKIEESSSLQVFMMIVEPGSLLGVELLR